MKVYVSTVFFSLFLGLAMSMASCLAEDDDSAYDQAGAAAENGDDAAGYANSGNYEGAAAAAGAGFDTAGSSTPPVYLDCDPCVVDPGDLKQYDPPQPSLQPSYVPPLPPSE